jgi:hypothetical protein
MRGVAAFTADIRSGDRRALDLFSSVLPGAGYAAAGVVFGLRTPLGAAG